VDSHAQFVVALIDDRKDVTLDEMVGRLFVERQVKISRSAPGAWLRAVGGLLKKDLTRTGARPTGRPEAPTRLVQWSIGPRSRQTDLIDGTGLSTKMSRLRGRGLRGERCRAGVPHGHCDAIARAGAELMFFLPYSPDFDPIENAFSKLKAMLRGRA
jgi:hypothetical protein